jgi:hypothetical protein
LTPKLDIGDSHSSLEIEELPISKKLKEEALKVTRDLRKRGFTHYRIGYGTVRHRRTRKAEYKYFIVFKASPWTAIEGVYMDTFFRRHIPKQDFQIYLYRNHKLFGYHGSSFTLHHTVRIRRPINP